MKQERQNKLSTQFAPETHEVVTKTGNIVVNESPEGVQLKRNTPHVKKYEELSLGQDTITPLPVETAPTEPEAVQGMAKSLFCQDRLESGSCKKSLRTLL